MKFLTAIGGIALAGLLVLTGFFAFNKDFRTSILNAWGIEYTIEDENGDDVIDVPVTGGEGTTAPDPGLDEPIEDETTEE